MAASRPISVQDPMADVTECSICVKVYANPKILPCVHTFCLVCLEKYGRDKKTGDQMACPICRSEFLIPDRGLCSLPHNFFINKMVEIRKLSETPTNEGLCATCPEEEKVKAKMFCFECEQNLCERCGITHSKIKFCQNHKVVVIGGKLKPHEVNSRNSYCDQHPGELVKMYCKDDKATICILCFSESHQSHNCVSVTEASEEFSYALKNDLETVMERLPELQTSLQKCDKWKKDFLAKIVDAESQILDEAVRLKVLINSHLNTLRQKLAALKDERLKKLTSTKQDMESFKVTTETYRKYCEELLIKGSPGDICWGADQLKVRAIELASLATNFCAHQFNWDAVIFKSVNLKDVFRMNSIANVIGDVQDSSVNDCFKQPVTHDAEKEELERKSEAVLNLEPNQLDLIKTEEFKKALKQDIPDLELELKQTQMNLHGLPDAVKRSRLYLLEGITAAVQDTFEISESISKVFAKDEVKPYLMEQLLSKGISASWMCNGRSVVVFAPDNENLEDAIRVLKNEVVEAHLNLGAVHLPEDFGQSPSWKGFIRCLCEEDRLLEVGISHSVIIATCLRNSIEKTKRRIEDFVFRSSLNGKDMFFRLAIRNKWK